MATLFDKPSFHHFLFPLRIRKGLPSEARVVSRILPQFLDDFFPPQDVMNKVIGEFLSNQQPYPQFMATVVYKVSSRTCVPSTNESDATISCLWHILVHTVTSSGTPWDFFGLASNLDQICLN